MRYHSYISEPFNHLDRVPYCFARQGTARVRLTYFSANSHAYLCSATGQSCRVQSLGWNFARLEGDIV
jgi:hypothetical protein